MSGATTIYSPPQRTYGQVLFKNVYAEDAHKRSTLPGVWLLMSQAAAAGSFAWFVMSVVQLLSFSWPLNFWLPIQLPVLLAFGAATGALKGVTIWLSTKILRRLPGAFIRSTISVLGVTGIWAAIYIFFPPSSAEPEIYYWAFGSSVFIGITIGLVTGSSFRPWQELVRGADEIAGWHSKICGGLTGLIMRTALLFLTMESLLVLIFGSQGVSQWKELLWTVVAVWHFAMASTIAFARVRFWPLVTLVVLVNVPLVMVLLVYRQDLGPGQYVFFGYFGAWLIFLLARWRPTYKILAVLDAEVHYYLID